MVIKNCVVCGKKFNAKYSAKTCSIECSKENDRKNRAKCMRNWRRKHKEKWKKTLEKWMNENIPEKGVCSKCGTNLTEKNWNLSDRKKHYYICKKCVAKKSKEWRKKNPEKSKEYSRRQNLKNRMRVLIHYGGNPPKCACCGESNIKFLTIDHIHGGGNKHKTKIGGFGNRLYLWLIKNDFPEGFQILCYNCNCARAHNNGICPHRDIYVY